MMRLASGVLIVLLLLVIESGEGIRRRVKKARNSFEDVLTRDCRSDGLTRTHM
jgi:hypothetical protein